MGSVAYGNFGHPELSDIPAMRFGADGRRRSANDHPGAAAEARPSRLVRAVQAARTRRFAFFDADMFADPAWDMLLELYGLHLEQISVSISGLCDSLFVPATTALRWMTRLEKDGLVFRRDDPNDARRSWVTLSPLGIEKMGRYFEMLPFGCHSV